MIHKPSPYFFHYYERLAVIPRPPRPTFISTTRDLGGFKGSVLPVKFNRWLLWKGFSLLTSWIPAWGFRHENLFAYNVVWLYSRVNRRFMKWANYSVLNSFYLPSFRLSWDEVKDLGKLWGDFERDGWDVGLASAYRRNNGFVDCYQCLVCGYFKQWDQDTPPTGSEIQDEHDRHSNVCHPAGTKKVVRFAAGDSVPPSKPFVSWN